MREGHSGITLRVMREEDIVQVSHLVTRVFNQFEAPEYSAEGVRNFLRDTDEEAFRKRMRSNRYILVALKDEAIVGVIDVRDDAHISLFFVDSAHHQQGIGKTLLRAALAHCQKNNPNVHAITVNSSPFAVAIYQRLGFVIISPEQVRDGIRYIPMSLSLP